MASDPALVEHFKSRLEWLKERETIWTNRLWRIALIGVTSSGKSTLVNALLDKDVLPVRVRPSSNSLVICRWGDQKKAIVHFENGATETLKGETLVARLKELSDETTNCENHAGVKEIELQWPGFRLGKEVALVDTPGLDAYGLERHEKLTLETLLPTVDLVVFLTTAKASADALIAEYLDRIHTHRKPLILVQNMMDSIEEKKGMGGVVERSREEVAREHFQRLSRLVRGRSWGQHNHVPIIQISAHLAFQGEFGKSNVQYLVEAIREKILNLEPLFYAGRLNQLAEELNQIVITYEPDQNMELKYKVIKRQKQELETLKMTVSDANIKISNDISGTIAKYLRQSKSINNKLIDFTSENIYHINKTIEKLINWLKNLDTELSNIVKQFRCTIILPNIKQLNLREEDLYFEYRSAPRKPSINPVVTEKKRVSMRNKPGFLNMIARIIPFVDLGREEVETRWDEVENVQALRAEIREAIANELQWAMDAKQDILKGSKKAISVITKEIKRKISDLEAPTRNQLNLIKQKAVVDSLKTIYNRIKANYPEIIKNQTAQVTEGKRWIDEPVQIEVPPLLLDMARYADLVSRRRFLHLRAALLNRVAERNPGKPTRALIWGFDEDSMERFLGRFWFDVIGGKPGPGRCFEVLEKSGEFQEIAVALEVTPSQGPPDLSPLASKFLKAGHSAVFVLLDAQQVGNTEKQWRRSALHAQIDEAGSFILVIQSIAGLVEPIRLAEGVWELLKIAHNLTPRPLGILVNDDESVWTVLADALYTEGNSLRTQADIQSWLGQMAIEDPKLSTKVAEALQAWLVMLNMDRSRK